jgi:hypothetical protein
MAKTSFYAESAPYEALEEPNEYAQEAAASAAAAAASATDTAAIAASVDTSVATAAASAAAAASSATNAAASATAAAGSASAASGSATAAAGSATAASGSATAASGSATAAAGSASTASTQASNASTSATAAATSATNAATSATNAATSASAAAASAASINSIPYAPSGRLSASSGVAVTSADQTSVSTLYYVALGQSKDPIYDGTNDVLRTIGTPSLTINATNNLADTQYDVYEIWDGTSVQLAAGVAWTTNTAGAGARGTGAGSAEVTTFNGRRVNANSMTMKNGGTTYTVPANRGNLVGGFRVISTAGATEDSAAKRFVWNEYNAVPRPLRRIENSGSWTYSVSAWRQANGATANRVEVFSGAAGRLTQAQVMGLMCNSSTTRRAGSVGIGVNSTTTNSAAIWVPAIADNFFIMTTANYNDYLPLGYNQINWLEWGAGGETQTWVGNFGTLYMQTGIIGVTIQ